MSKKVVPPRQQFRGQEVFYIQPSIPNQQGSQTQQLWEQTGYSQQSGTNTGFPQQAYPQQSQWKQPLKPHYSTAQRTQYAGQFIQKHVHTPPLQFQQRVSKPSKRNFFNKKVPVPLWGIILASVLFVSVVITSVYATGSRVISPNPSISPPTSSSNPVGETNSAATTPTFIATTIPLSAPTSVSTSVEIPKVGGTIITVDGLTCTLLSVQRIQGDDITYPKPGDMFIVVHVKMTNSSSSDYSYLSINFQVISGTGNGSGSIDVAPSTYTAKNQILMGTLIPGGTVQGDLIFEVTIGDHKAELSWQPDPTGSITENVWNLGL